MNGVSLEGDKVKNGKWLQIMGLAMSLPTLIFVSGWGTMQLAKKKIISEKVAILIFLAIIGNTLFTMVYYAYKRKD